MVPSIFVSSVARGGVLLCEGWPFQKPRRHRSFVRGGYREVPDALLHLAINVLDYVAGKLGEEYAIYRCDGASTAGTWAYSVL